MKQYEMLVLAQADEVKFYKYAQKVLAAAAIDSVVSIVAFLAVYVAGYTIGSAGAVGFAVLMMGVLLFFGIQVIDAIDKPAPKQIGK